MVSWVDGPSTSEYIIIADLPNSLRNRYNIEALDTNPKLRSRLKELDMEICSKFQAIVAEGLTLKVIDADDLSKKIFAAAKKLDSNPFVVSLDRSYFPEARHLDPTTEYGSARVVGHYSRPNLETEATEIMRESASLSLLRGGDKKGVILVDVGIYNGATLSRVIPMLEQRDVKIDGIVVGIVSPRIKSYAQFLSFDVIAVEPTNYSVWVDSRDIFLIDGKQIPSNIGIDKYERKFVPFIDDVENAVNAGIKREKLGELRSLCFEANSRLFSTLREFGVSTDTISTPISSRLVDASARRMKTF